MALEVRQESKPLLPPAASAFKGSFPLPVLASKFKGRQADGYDFTFAVTGQEREGKSTVLIELASMLDPGLEADLEGRLAYTNTHLQHLIGTLYDGGAILPDEAIVTSWKQRWGSRGQKDTYIDLVTSAVRGHVVGFALPDLGELHTPIRNRRLHIHIFVPYRGLALIYGKAPIPGQEDPWHLGYWKRLADSWTPQTRPQQIISRLKQPKIGYLGFSTFPKLPQEVEARYRVAKQAGLQKARDEERKRGPAADEKWESVAAKLMGVAAARGASAADIAKEAELPPEFLRRVIEKSKATGESHSGTGSGGA